MWTSKTRITRGVAIHRDTGTRHSERGQSRLDSRSRLDPRPRADTLSLSTLRPGSRRRDPHSHAHGEARAGCPVGRHTHTPHERHMGGVGPRALARSVVSLSHLSALSTPSSEQTETSRHVRHARVHRPIEFECVSGTKTQHLSSPTRCTGPQPPGPCRSPLPTHACHQHHICDLLLPLTGARHQVAHTTQPPQQCGLRQHTPTMLSHAPPDTADGHAKLMRSSLGAIHLRAGHRPRGCHRR